MLWLGNPFWLAFTTTSAAVTGALCVEVEQGIVHVCVGQGIVHGRVHGHAVRCVVWTTALHSPSCPLPCPFHGAKILFSCTPTSFSCAARTTCTGGGP